MSDSFSGLQAILGTDKKNPMFAVYRVTGRFKVYHPWSVQSVPPHGLFELKADRCRVQVRTCGTGAAVAGFGCPAKRRKALLESTFPRDIRVMRPTVVLAGGLSGACQPPRPGQDDQREHPMPKKTPRPEAFSCCFGKRAGHRAAFLGVVFAVALGFVSFGGAARSLRR